MARKKSAVLAFFSTVCSIACAPLAATLVTHCEPADEGPALATPATPQAQAHAPGEPPPGAPPMPSAPPPGAVLTPTAPPPGFPAPSGAPAGSGPPSATAGATGAPVSYASGEYAIGVDSDAYDDSDPSALTDFRFALDPYGTWANDSAYGTVWTPSADAIGSGFAPYLSSGHWAYDGDWVWVSDYPWGWVPFHYGRWVLIAGRGWSWIPGRAYRGAWVSWAVDDAFEYVGWAPLAPEFVWVGGAAATWHGVATQSFVYCPRTAVFSPQVGAKVAVGPGAIAARMRPYVAVTAQGRGATGPSPARLGYGAGPVPRPQGAGAAGIEKALQFARRSTTPGANGDAGRR
jgi:uncharacterized protein DUF6600